MARISAVAGRLVRSPWLPASAKLTSPLEARPTPRPSRTKVCASCAQGRKGTARDSFDLNAMARSCRACASKRAFLDAQACGKLPPRLAEVPRPGSQTHAQNGIAADCQASRADAVPGAGPPRRARAGLQPQLEIAKPGPARFEPDRQKAEPGCPTWGAAAPIHRNLQPTECPGAEPAGGPAGRVADDMRAPSAALTSPAAGRPCSRRKCSAAQTLGSCEGKLALIGSL